MDVLTVEGLQVKTKIGIYPWEQQILQTLLIDITIPTNFSQCDDNIESTLDYALLCNEITTYLEVNHFQLIETVVQRLIEFIQREFNVPKLTVRVSKPQAVKNAKNVSVTCSR